MSAGVERQISQLHTLIGGIKVAGASGSATSLVTTSTPVDFVSIKAHYHNSDVIFIGPSGQEVYPLAANHSIDMSVVNLNRISVSGTLASNQRLHYIAGKL